MALDPALAPFLPVPPMGEITDFPAFRAQGAAMDADFFARVAEPAPAIHERRVVTIPVPGGTIDLVVFRPDGRSGLPVHVFLHGGGWIVGSANAASTDVVAAERAVLAGCVVVAVDYRLAPEHPFPVPLEDCQAGLEWVVANAGDLGVDASRLTVGGGSAGANLAAALCLKLRDEGGPAVALQLLEVPTLDLTLSVPSQADAELGSRYSLHADDFRRMVDAYVGSPDTPAARDPYASPLLAPDLAGVAPACVMVAELDILRDEGLRYHERLVEAGVPSTLYVGEGLAHGSQAFTLLSEAARAWRTELMRALRAAHGDGAPA